MSNKVTMQDRRGKKQHRKSNAKQEVIFDFEASTLVVAIMLKLGAKRLTLTPDDVARVSNRTMAVSEREDGSVFFKIN